MRLTAARVAAVLAALILSACARGPLSHPEDLTGAKWNVDAVDALERHPDPYFAALHDGFVALARAEQAEFDWVDTAHFVGLATHASQGREIAPVHPSERDVHPSLVDELATSHAELTGFIASAGGRLRAGEHIGTAHVHYQCWLQEAEEGHQSDEISGCRVLYEERMLLVRALAPLPANLAVVLSEGGGVEIAGSGGRTTLDTPFAAGSVAADAGGVPVTEEEIRDAFAMALGAQPPPPIRFTVTFDFGSARLGDEAFVEIARATEAALQRPQAEMIVTGYADAPGTNAANLHLSARRAAAVRREVLRELGASDGGIESVSVARARARGERDLEVDTAARSRLNRRVVILVR